MKTSFRRLQLAAFITLSSLSARADFSTPFIEPPGNKVGDESTSHAYILIVGPPEAVGPDYRVVVLTDTEEYLAIPARAKKGVVSDALLGREVKVRAKILQQGSGKNGRPEIEILSVEPLGPPQPAKAGNGPKSEAGGRAPLLAEVAPKYQGAALQVAAVLGKQGWDPTEFYVFIEEKEGGASLVFNLTHKDSSLPENQDKLGNPSGKDCRITFDVRTGKASLAIYQ